MKIKIDAQYGIPVIELKGNLVGGDNAQLFRDKLYELVADNKNKVVVDMSDVKFVNSTGIGILISGLTTLKNVGGELKLSNISTKVHGVLSITKLTQVFNIYNSVEEALKDFS